MLQELGAFILAGAKGAKDVKTMAEMICGARGWRWVGVYKAHARRAALHRGQRRRTAVLQGFPGDAGALRRGSRVA
jgi:hypothetical protein